jgi:hypothetical protein
MDRTATESTPGAAPVVAPTSQDREAVAAAQDAAWADDKTDVGAGEVAPDGGTPPETDVITDKPGMASVTPAPKPGVAVGGEKPADEPAEPVKADEAAEVVEAVSPTEKADAYWKKLSEVFPGATNAVETPLFKAWYETLSPADKAAAADLDKPDEAIRLMGRYYDDVTNGRVKEPAPPLPPKPFEVSAWLAERGMSELKIKRADGSEIALGDMAKPEEFGEVIGAMGAMTRASEQAIVAHFQGQIQQLSGQVSQLLERLGEKDLAAKVPDASEVVKDPAFSEFRNRSALLKNAWASGDPTNRADVIAMFKAERAKATVTDTAAGQRKTNAAKNALHSGTLRGGVPGSGRPAADDKTVGEQQDAAWDTPLDVEGQKV